MNAHCAWILLVCLSLGCQPAAAPETEDQKTLYALGLSLAQRLGTYALTEQEVPFVVAGFGDGVAGREPKLDPESYRRQIAELGQRGLAARAALEQEASKSFLEAEAAEPGATTMDSGLILRELIAGEGESPSPDSHVVVHYHGTLRDGTVFDSSVERGSPAEFPVRGVIRCWTEALQLMKPGGKAVIVCPASIAYGNRGRSPLIKPGAALRFEVELIEVVE